MKKFLALTLIFFAIFTSYAEKIKSTSKNYRLELFYDVNAYPGDAVFIKMILKPRTKIAKKSIGSTVANACIYNKNYSANNSKPLKKANFYLINTEEGLKKSLAQYDVALVGLPLSTYFNCNDYIIKIKLNAFGIEENEIEIPLKVLEKEFISETIPLNAKNTSIRTDTSSKRMEQITRLNNILETIDTQGVYQSKQFTPPTNATRRTSFFGDRRIFAYSNGKSSTTLHYGIDYGVPTGTNVTSCARGKVVLAEDRISTGWSICIEHLPGLYSLYYHMSKLNVEEGQIVQEGELLGLSGATGLATGPHLHWEVRLNMEAISPDFFTKDFAFFNE